MTLYGNVAPSSLLSISLVGWTLKCVCDLPGEGATHGMLLATQTRCFLPLWYLAQHQKTVLMEKTLEGFGLKQIHAGRRFWSWDLRATVSGSKLQGSCEEPLHGSKQEPLSQPLQELDIGLFEHLEGTKIHNSWRYTLCFLNSLAETLAFVSQGPLVTPFS